MKEFTVNEGRMVGVEEKPVEGNQDMLRLEPLSWWRRLLKELRTSFNGPFDLDWEEKAGLQ
jgi:hypothetical protein